MDENLFVAAQKTGYSQNKLHVFARAFALAYVRMCLVGEAACLPTHLHACMHACLYVCYVRMLCACACKCVYR